MHKFLSLLAVAAFATAGSAAAAEPPGNDAQAAAAALTTFPASVDGSTIGSTAERGDPTCDWPTSGTVWYSLSRADDLTIVVGFQAHGELDAVVGAFEVVKGGLKTLLCVASDSRGKAGFSFPGHKDGRYLILVGQRANSVAGTFHLTVQSPPRPPNDDRAGARLLKRLPAAPTGTTLGGSVDPQTPQCGTLGADVWYRFTRPADGFVVVTMQAHGDLDGTVAVYRQIRSQLERQSCTETDSKGRAGLTFDAHKGGRYLIAVGQLASSPPGSFALHVFAPETPAAAPGSALVRGSAHATVNALTDRDDAYAVSMHAGESYRFNLVARRTCVSFELYPPRTRSFDGVEPLLRQSCSGYRVFTPGPDGGGTYSVRILPDSGSSGAQPYALHFAAAAADDVGPGLSMTNGRSYRGSLDGGGIDVVDLYRFDVSQRSDVDLQLHVVGHGDVHPTLLSEEQPSIRIKPIRDLFRVRLHAGRYFVRLSATTSQSARYRIGLLIREITVTKITVEGRKLEVIDTPRPVKLTAHVQPESASGGVVRVQVNYYDPLQGWIFVQQFTPRVRGTEASVMFLPRRIGHYKVRAAYFGNHAASPSETDRAANLLVGVPAL